MRYLLGTVVLLASLAAVAVTMTMNASYHYAQGATPLESLLRALAMGAFDCFKAGLPVGMAWWVAHRQWRLFVISVPIFCFCFVVSLLSAIGFYATSHSAVRQSRDGVTTRYHDARAELEQTEARLKQLGTARPQDAVEAAIQALQTDKRFTTSKECSEATLPASRDFCRDYFLTVSEREAAREVQKLRRRQGELKTTITELIAAGAERDADPQVTVLSRLFPFLSQQDVRLGVDLLPSVLLELVASFGLVLAAGMLKWAPSAKAAPPPNTETRSPEGGTTTKPLKPMIFKVLKDGTYVITD